MTREHKLFSGRIDPRDGVVVRASASQLVVLGLIFLVESYQKTKKMVFTASMLGALCIEERFWRTTYQVRLLYSWARHLRDARLCVEDKWPRHLGNGNPQASADIPSKI